ncbi:hypothetical protein BJ138DRAFT_821747, partial [Hygrophoropsis aurantiaca]
MHSSLRLEEIFENILLYLDRKTIAALGQTCRTFHEPSLDALWFHLSSLTPLVKTLPRDLWKIDERQNFNNIVIQRPMGLEDWTTFRRNARRVRSLKIFSEQPEEAAIFALVSTPPDPSYLFPNLRQLHWIDWLE